MIKSGEIMLKYGVTSPFVQVPQAALTDWSRQETRKINFEMDPIGAARKKRQGPVYRQVFHGFSNWFPSNMIKHADFPWPGLIISGIRKKLPSGNEK